LTILAVLEKRRHQKRRNEVTRALVRERARLDVGILVRLQAMISGQMKKDNTEHTNNTYCSESAQGG